MAPVFFAQLYFHEASYIFSGEFPSANLRNGGAQFDILLGMNFLKNFDMQMSSKDMLVQLTLAVP